MSTQMSTQMSTTIAEKRAANRAAKYSALMRMHGPLPAKRGVGDLYEIVVLGSAYGTSHYRDYGDRSTVARSYKYPVWDHHIEWTIPRAHVLTLIAGVPIGTRPSDVRRSRTRPVRARWPQKAAGYSGRWVAGWLYRGVHLRAASADAARRRVDRQRAANARRLLLVRADTAQARRARRARWITPAMLRAAGACAPGIDAARQEIQRMLAADGEIGAAYAPWVASIRPEWARYVDRALAI